MEIKRYKINLSKNKLVRIEIAKKIIHKKIDFTLNTTLKTQFQKVIRFYDDVISDSYKNRC